jgi:hypothetical protein
VIEDLSGSGNSETILETETTTFSENIPFFQNNYEKQQKRKCTKCETP